MVSDLAQIVTDKISILIDEKFAGLLDSPAGFRNTPLVLEKTYFGHGARGDVSTMVCEGNGGTY